MTTSKEAPRTPLFNEIFGSIWAALYYFFLFTRSTEYPANVATFWGLALFGLVYALVMERARFLKLLASYRWLWGSILMFSIGILVSESLAIDRYELPFLEIVTSQSSMILCIPILALLLQDKWVMRSSIVLFALFCLWHFWDMPYESITGNRLGWWANGQELLERHSGIFNYQAAGLALQTYYFPGLFMPLLYFVIGPLYEKRVFAGNRIPRWILILLAFLWLFPVASVQSRSAFFGALLAAVVFTFDLRKMNKYVWFAIPPILLLAGGVYLAMFSENKSGFGLRWVYMKLYFMRSLDWPYIFIGHGFNVDRYAMLIPDTVPLSHSHNDITEMVWRWGWLVFAAYVSVWWQTLKLIFRRFLKRAENWPLCIVIALFPNMMTDLGFLHFEKAACLSLLIACCAAFASIEDEAATAASPAAATQPPRAKSLAKR